MFAAENPRYNALQQRIEFRESKPSKPPERGTKEFKMLEDFCGNIQLILQVVNENEYQAAVTFMEPPENTLFLRAVVFPRPGVVIGKFGNKKAALIHTGEGNDCSDYVQDAIETFPKAQFVIGTGVGYAFDSEQYKLGDVLVSTKICHLKNLKLSAEGEIVDRGERVDVVRDLTSMFCKDLTREKDFIVSDKNRCSEVRAGQIVSLSATVDNREYRDKIHRSVKEAIGGDMEGGQLLKFWSKRRIEGIVIIKGVAHYADGSRGDKIWEFTAALAALEYVKGKLEYCINEGQVIATLMAE